MVPGMITEMAELWVADGTLDLHPVDTMTSHLLWSVSIFLLLDLLLICQTGDRLEQARKVQNLLATLGGPAPPSSAGPPQRPPPQQDFRNGGIGHSTPMYQPVNQNQPPPSMSPAQRSSDPRLGNNGPRPLHSIPGDLKGSIGGPGPQTYNYPSSGAPSQPSYPSGSGGGIPPEVLSLLQANNVAPPSQLQPSLYSSGPPLPAASSNGQFRPPPSMPPGPAQGYGQGQQQGYPPGPGSGDVGSLLAMLVSLVTSERHGKD